MASTGFSADNRGDQVVTPSCRIATLPVWQTRGLFLIQVLGGRPCIRGTRSSVQFVLELLASGASQADIKGAYPGIPPEGIAAAIQYAARSLENEVVWDVRIPA